VGNVRSTGFISGRFHDNGLSGITGIIGQPRTGKSFLMGKLIRGCARVLVMDTVHQYGSGPRQNPLPGFITMREPGELVRYWRRYRHGKFRIIYQPGFDLQAHFDAVARLVLEVRDTVFAVDEIWNYCKAGWSPPPLEFMSRAGRHRGITLLYTGQRPQLVAADLRDNTNEWRIFRLQGELPIRALRGKVPDAALMQVETLPDRVYVQSDECMNWRVIK
jgi:hypothetical protein